MKRIVCEEDKQPGVTTIGKVSAHDMVIVGTKQWIPQNMYDVIIIGTIYQDIGLKGALSCNIDYSKMNLEDFKIQPVEYNMSISTIERGLSHNTIRAYTIIDIQDARDAMADIMSWHEFPNGDIPK